MKEARGPGVKYRSTFGLALAEVWKAKTIVLRASKSMVKPHNADVGNENRSGQRRPKDAVYV